MKAIVARLAILVVTGLVAIVAVEAVLRAIADPELFLPYHRNSVRVVYPSEEVTPGVSGVSRFTTNGHGTRGPEFAGQPVRILTVGGSTTACSVLDDAESWPALWMERLNQRSPGTHWVTNSAIDGHNSEHHVMHAAYLLPRLPALDWVLYYAGANDLGSWLYRTEFDPHALDDPEHWNHRIGEAFRVSRHTPADWPAYKRLEIWKRASVIKDRLRSVRQAAQPADGRVVQDARLRWMKEARARFQAREDRFVHRAKLETLPAALDAYERNLRRIVQLTRESGAEPILAGQAMLLHTRQAVDEDQLWMGAMDGGEANVRREQFTELVDRYNARMARVAASMDVRFVDVPARLAPASEVFYDGMHFNEAGARAMADALMAELGTLADRRPDPTP